jgi:RND superfamily putative drug exporter
MARRSSQESIDRHTHVEHEKIVKGTTTMLAPTTSLFASWGRLVYRHRWLTLFASLALFAATVVATMQGGTLGFTNSTQTESGRADALMHQELPRSTASGSSFVLVFGSASLTTGAPPFRAAMLGALAPLRSNGHVASVQTPYNVPAAQAAAMLSRDGHHALAVIAVKDAAAVAKGYYPSLRSLVHSGTLDVAASGDLAINHDFNHILGQDLQRAERLSFPLTLVLLLIVFGTVIAAALPLGVGLLTVVGGMGGVLLLTRVTSVAEYALNIVTLIGLGVAFDYSLFIVNRFREELAGGATVEESLARALATAGRAITFSGLSVAIGLAGLLFYQGTFLASMGLAGAISVAFAVAYALTILPALLAVLGPRINAWRLPLPRPRSGRGFWHTLVGGVMRRPRLVLAATLAIVLLAGSPFLGLRMAGSGVTGLPPQAESYRGYHLLVTQFPGQDETQITVVVHYPSGPALTADRAGSLYDLSHRIAALPNVLRVESPVDLAPTFGRSYYRALYARPYAALPAGVRAAIHGRVGPHIVVLDVLTAQPASSDAARAIVRAIRALHTMAGGQILVTNTTATDIDSIDLILSRTPLAIGFIVLMTYVVLFLMLGSVLLPLKAVVTNLLSISASFGALVWIFQQGHLSAQLNFTPGSLDPSIPVLLFCIVFGLSMDYEVLLLSRMKEEYERTGDTRRAVAEGIGRSGRLITGAAAIMVAVFLCFGLAETSVIKSIGLGMAIAVTVDATIVRALLVPALMCLLGRLCWWAPRPLAQLHRRLNLGEAGHAQPVQENAAA